MTVSCVNSCEDVTSESVHIIFCDGDAITSGADAAETYRFCHRVLRPGGFLFAFAAPQSFHRVALAVEASVPLGQFEMRDAITWVHEVQPLADTGLPGRATLIALVQKAKDGTFMDNWGRHSVGLIDTRVKWKGKVPSNVIDGEKCDRADVATHLLRVFGHPGCAVLDPWQVSGDFETAASRAGAIFTGARARSHQSAIA